MAFVLRDGGARQNFQILLRFILVLFALVLFYTIMFQVLMSMEGQEHSWVSGVYWTFVTMSTLGFGEITFESDLGRIFSIIVLLSGTLFMLVLLPFTFIQFFYAPWMEAQQRARAPRELEPDTKGHAILTQYDPVTSALITKLKQYHYPYVLLVPDINEALRLQDLRIKVLVGDLDNPDVYRKARVENASLVATTADDRVNTNVAFTVRELSESVPIVSTAKDLASMDILELAGSSHVLHLGHALGGALARRVIAGDAMTHVIGQFDGLRIAEATAAGTPLVGKTLKESKLRDLTGVSVTGVWERGDFIPARSDTIITKHSVLLIAGSSEQLLRYDELFCIYHVSGSPIVIIGGGRVGRATGTSLDGREVDYRIIEKLPERVRDSDKYVVGDAAELAVLEQAGIQDTPAVVITTHDDDTNIYLTIYCRRLRPDIQIISRATLDRNVATLHRAGADFVMSYASMGANTIFNLLKRGDVLLVAEGLDIFKVKVPHALEGKTIAESTLREKTGCSVVAVDSGKEMEINPEPSLVLSANREIVLIGNLDAEEKFLELFADG